MTIFNLGSINADLFYSLPHLPLPGETLASSEYSRGLGGKGANMSVATSRAASRVVHIGAVGEDGQWAKDRLTEYGVDTRHILRSNEATGHALILVDQAGENSIVLYQGANHALTDAQIADALAEATDSDLFIFQNETNHQRLGAEMASEKGMRVCYAAAPFEAAAVQAVLPLLDLLILNEVEAQQLSEAMGCPVTDLPVRDIIVTLGADGCDWHNTDSQTTVHIPAIPVTPVDTTGAGDTFTGYLLAGLDQGMPMEQALVRASKAGALMVTRHGTADVIPDLKDIQDSGL